MKLVSWNVNGLRSCLTKGFLEYVKNEDPDILCLQETKLQPEQAVFDLEGYHRYFHSADKKGYSGTAIWAKTPALSVNYGIDCEAHSHEGRAITLEYPNFYLVNLYVPNSQNELARIDYRMQWEDDLRTYLKKLDAVKPVILCGDLNVAHEDIDLKNPGPNRGAAGFSDQERGKLDELLAAAGSATGQAQELAFLPVSPTVSAACTPPTPACTAGGACASAPVSGTQDGVSTISSSATAWPPTSKRPVS